MYDAWTIGIALYLTASIAGILLMNLYGPNPNEKP